MFSQNRQQLRQFYFNVWEKKHKNQPLNALEAGIANVIEQHPEYHVIFANENNLEQDYFVDNDQTNPFLHMGLHISLHEQILIDRPADITAIYQQLLKQFGDAHETEHQMMACLTESLWLAQRNHRPPSETAYLDALKQLSHNK